MLSDPRESVIRVTQVRLGRPTNQLEALLRFYCTGLGLELLLPFPEDAAGYSGVVLGLPGHPYHLEFCTHRAGFQDCHPPTRDNLLVFFLEESTDLERLIQHMSKLGFPPVPATNPHWERDGVTFEDPDGWRVVLMRYSNVKTSK